MSTRAALLLVLGLAACGQSQGQRVTLDLTGVQQAAILSPGDTVTVRARAGTFDETVPIDLTATTFSMEVPSGMVLIEAEADRQGTPYYFGDVRVNVIADGTTSVVVPFFPAGGIAVNVKLPTGFTLPPAVLEMTPAAPKPDESIAFDADLVAGVLARPLPAGDYTYKALLSTDGGKTWKSVYSPGTVITIVQSQVLAISADLSNVKL